MPYIVSIPIIGVIRLALEKMAAGWGCVVGREINDSGVFVDYADDMLAERFCHVSRQLQGVTRLEPSDYAVCMMPIATRACRRK